MSTTIGKMTFTITSCLAWFLWVCSSPPLTYLLDHRTGWHSWRVWTKTLGVPSAPYFSLDGQEHLQHATEGLRENAAYHKPGEWEAKTQIAWEQSVAAYGNPWRLQRLVLHTHRRAQGLHRSGSGRGPKNAAGQRQHRLIATIQTLTMQCIFAGGYFYINITSCGFYTIWWYRYSLSFGICYVI